MSNFQAFYIGIHLASIKTKGGEDLKTVINNGTLIDPKNKIFSNLNIEITDGKISRISNNVLQGDISIDAKGMIVSPGFVDLHMHEDDYNKNEDKFNIDIFDCMLKMGITTAVGGNCGIGTLEPDLYLESADRLGLPVNIGLLVPHGSLREQLGITDKYLSTDTTSIKSMSKSAEKYLSDGCLGISFGIRYIPGMNTEEITCISNAAKTEQKVVAAHIRDDVQNVIAASLEFINCGIKADVPIQLSHIGSMGAFGQMSQLLSLIDYYNAKGIDLSADCYPYSAFSTHLGATTYDPGFKDRYGCGFGDIEIAEGEFKGRRLDESLYKILREESPELLTVAYVMKEEEVASAMVHPNVIIASDGLLNNSQGHPRASSTFPKFLNQYVVKENKLNIYEAIKKITVDPADRMGIKKGSLGLGDDVDIVIFDINSIKDNASFTSPMEDPDGIQYVLINGKVALKKNKIIKGNLGKSVRK